jgi:hypothetical protein
METGQDFLASCHQIASSREIGEGFASVIGLVLTMAADGFVDKPLLSSHLAQALMYRPKAANEGCWSNSVGRPLHRARSLPAEKQRDARRFSIALLCYVSYTRYLL